MDTTQVLKGVLDTAVLASLRIRPTYGYDLVRHLRDQGFTKIADASVYGTLRRLHEAGFVTSTIVESEVGPARKYYSLSNAGTEELAQSTKTWNEINESMDRILDQGDDHEKT